MRKIDIRKLVFVVLFVSSFCNTIYAWDDKATHRDLSKYSADSSTLRFCSNAQDRNCDFLKDLGLNNGLLEILEWTESPTIRKGKVEDWLQDGAEREDYAGPLQRNIRG